MTPASSREAWRAARLALEEDLAGYGDVTGLGAIDAPDNAPPPATQFAAELTVGGKPAKVNYSGRDTCCAARFSCRKPSRRAWLERLDTTSTTRDASGT